MFPTQLVRPIHKDTTSYRHIAIIIEKCFIEQINAYISDNGITNGKQFSFRRKKAQRDHYLYL